LRAIPKVKQLAYGLADRAVRLLAALKRRRGHRWDAVIILLPRPLGRGDLVMLSPVILRLVAHFQDRKVVVVTGYEPFLDVAQAQWIREGELVVSEYRAPLYVSLSVGWRTLPYCLRRGDFVGFFSSSRMVSSFDTGKPATEYDARGEHYLERGLRVLDAIGVPYDRGGLAYARPLLKPAAGVGANGPYVCVAPYVSWPERQWPREHYGELVRLLSAEVRVVILGGPNPSEVELNAWVASQARADNVTNLTGQLDWRETAWVISRARLFVGNDSGPAHLAYACGVPSVLIYGSVAPETRIPRNPRLANTIAALDRRDVCPEFPCYDGYSRPSCTHALACLKAVSVESALIAIRKSLNREHAAADVRG
jgi:ADP-heptose:LPS heptosyltransferase